MNEKLLTTIVEEVDAHERKINELHQIIQQASNDADTLHLIHASVNEIKVQVHQVSFLGKDLQQLSSCLTENMEALRRPAQQKVIHHHHASKLIWIAAALFLLVCLLLSGWYMTANKLQLYQVNDTKFRYLKLQSNMVVRRWCRITDSLFMVDENMRAVVLEQEEQKQRNIGMLHRAMEMEEEARKLKQHLKGSGNADTNEEKK